MPLIIILSIIVLLLVFLFLIFPSPRRHKDREVLNGLYIAHRGLHNIDKGIPENSINAFKAAIGENFAIEIDIHLTKDNKVVVFHDDTALRMCSVDKNICDMSLEEIKRLNLASTGIKIPTLEECLEVIDGKVPLLVEIKYDPGTATNLCKAANKLLSGYKGKYFVQSFYPQILHWYRKNRPDICRGQLSCRFKNDKFYKKLSGCLLFNFISRPDFVSYEHCDANHPCFALVKMLGAFPVCWTIKNENELKESKKHFKTYIFEGFMPKK